MRYILMEPMQILFAVLFVSGLILLAAEVFVPGGILGAMGALALVGAIVTAFLAFGPTSGIWIGLGIIVFAGVVLVLWVKYFPRSRIGKSLTLSEDGSDFKAQEDDLEVLLGKVGESLSDLRPAGFVRLEGRRIDVVTRGNMIEKGEQVMVVDIEGNRVVVKKIQN